MVGVRGFEPPTPASRTQYSTRLSYTPKPSLDTYYLKQFMPKLVGCNCTQEGKSEQSKIFAKNRLEKEPMARIGFMRGLQSTPISVIDHWIRSSSPL